MLFANPLGVADSQAMSGAPWACAGATSRKHVAPTTPKIRIEDAFMLYRYLTSLIFGQGTNTVTIQVSGCFRPHPGEREDCLPRWDGMERFGGWCVESAALIKCACDALSAERHDFVPAR